MATEWEELIDALPASIGGASFKIRSAKTSVGNRVVVQEFPNTAYVRGQDLGPKADAFDVDGFIAGDDYITKRRALERVFKSAGPHLLVHPFRGRLLVVIDNGGELTISEDISRLGYATISFKCRETNDGDPTRSVQSPEDVATSAVSTARSASASSLSTLASRLDNEIVQSAFLAKVSDVQDFLSSQISAVLDVADTVSSAYVNTVDSLLSSVTSALAAPETAFEAIAAAVRATIKVPFAIETSAVTTYGQLTDGRRIGMMLGIVGRLSVGGVENDLAPLPSGALQAPLDGTESTATASDRNAEALSACVRAESLASLVESIVAVAPESQDQAAEVLAMVNRLLIGPIEGDPDALLYAVDGDLFVALSDLRAAFSRYLAETSLDLPSVHTYEVPARISALLLAQALLGDASRFSELLERNAIDDPLAIEAGTVIEYLAA